MSNCPTSHMFILYTHTAVLYIYIWNFTPRVGLKVDRFSIHNKKIDINVILFTS